MPTPSLALRFKRFSFGTIFAILGSLYGGCGDDHEGRPGAEDGSLGDAMIVPADGGYMTDAWTGDGAVHDTGVSPSPEAGVEAGIDGGFDSGTGAGVDSGTGSDGRALLPPTAGFQLTAPTGTTPFWVQAVSSASGGDGAPLETRYDWGEGTGFESRGSHRYLHAGTFTVTQEVRDVNGLTAQATSSVSVTDFAPVRLSRTDHSSHLFVSDDAYQLELRGWGAGGVRSDSAIQPGSGIFYFEWRRIIDRAIGDFGVATAQAAINEAPGASAQSMGALAWGPVQSAGGTCMGSTTRDTSPADIGFVVDYRAATPIVHVIQAAASGVAAVRSSCTMAVSAPLYAFYSGERAVVGDQARINTGADTTNFPFHFGDAEVRAALTAYGDASGASALVLGFGKTRATRVDSPPTLTVPADLSVAQGQPVILQGTADDVEDGDLSDQIVWNDISAQHHAPVTGTGRSFSFTPATIGRHPVDATVQDGDGVVTTRRVMVTVTGSLPQANPVLLARDALTNDGITLSSDALSASFNGPSKDGIRANQAIYGRFWYFEVHRNVPLRNMGIGLVIGDGNLNPYDAPEVPWSCSVNVQHGFWVNLISEQDYTGAEPNADYGVAVDYRGEHPIVYYLIGGTLQATLALTQIWVPMYPLLYGNPPETASGAEMTINFGATAFRLDPKAILSAANVDASGLQLGWGDAYAH